MLIFSPTFVQFRHIKKSVIVRFDIDAKSTEIHEILRILNNLYTGGRPRARGCRSVVKFFVFFTREFSHILMDRGRGGAQIIVKKLTMFMVLGTRSKIAMPGAITVCIILRCSRIHLHFQIWQKNIDIAR